MRRRPSRAQRILEGVVELLEVIEHLGGHHRSELALTEVFVLIELFAVKGGTVFLCRFCLGQQQYNIIIVQLGKVWRGGGLHLWD